jgi:mRNA interferase HigB
MQVISKRTLRLFWEKHQASRVPLSIWHAKVSKAAWSGPVDIKNDFGNTVDFIGDNRVIFDIGGNKYRLITHVTYAYKSVLIKFGCTHKEYDEINPETI